MPKNIKILIFGNGYLGNRLAEYFHTNALISRADITIYSEIEKDIRKYSPEIIINAAAKTNIDWVEKQENRREAYAVNVGGAANVFFAARTNNIFLCHISSGCIFDGITLGGFKENDMPNPSCYYAWTKIWGESQLFPFFDSKKVLVLRIRMPISQKFHPRNLINKLMKYDKVIDDQNSITVIEDFLPAMKKFLKNRIYGTFHLTNTGSISPYEIIQIMKKKGLINPNKKVKKITKEELDRLTLKGGGARRVSTILNTDKLKKLHINLPNVKERVEECIKNFKV